MVDKKYKGCIIRNRSVLLRPGEKGTDMVSGPISCGEMETLGQYAELGFAECREIAELAAEQAREDWAEKLGFPVGAFIKWSTLTLPQSLSRN